MEKEIEDLQSAVIAQLATRKPPNNIPIDAVVRDYYELNGEHIPYQRLGFTTLVEFLKTIPEIDLYQCGVKHYINFKGKPSIKHVTDLVARTNKKPSRNYKGNVNRSRSASTWKTAPPGYRPPQDYNNRPHDSASSSSSIIDPAVTDQILSILKEFPNGLFLSELLEKLYKRAQLNLSNNQIQEHLKILEREVMTKDNMIYLRRSSPRESAPKSSRSQSAPSRRYHQSKHSDDFNGGNRNRDNYEKNYKNKENYGSSNGQYESNYQYNSIEKNNYQNTSTEKNYSQNVLSKNFKIAGIESEDDFIDDYNNDFDCVPSTGNEFNGNYGIDKKNAVGSQYYGNSSKPVQGISDSREVKDVDNINYAQQHSNFNAVKSIDHNKTYESNYHHEFEAANPTVNISGDAVSQAGSVDREILFERNKKLIAASLSQRTVLRLQKLLENNPYGIWCLELPALYEKEYKLTLEWEQSNCQRLSDFVSYLPHIFYKIGPYRRGDYKLFDARKPIPDENDKMGHQTQTLASVYNSYNGNDFDEESIPQRISCPTLRRQLTPPDVLNNNETVGCIFVSQYLPSKDETGGDKIHSIPVNVVEAFDPSFFWIQLSKNKPVFDTMMEDLGRFYDENSAKYALSPIIMEERLNVACKFYGVWHRGMIKTISPSRKSAKIHFYDFGTLKSYPTEELFFLKRTFGILPAQAIPCGLYSLKPKKREGKDDTWCNEARDLFIKMAFKAEMWATITKVDIDNNSMLISLTDTSGTEDVHLADTLVRYKYAERSKTDVVVDPNNLELYVEDYGDYNTPSVSESQQPAPNNFATPPGPMSSAVPSIQNIGALVNSALTPNVLSTPMGGAVRDKIIKVLDQYTQAALNLYKSMVVTEMESMGLEAIKNNLYDLYAKLFYQTMNSASHGAASSAAFTPNQSVCENSTSLSTNNQLLQFAKDQSLLEIQSIADSDATLTNEMSDADVLGESAKNLPMENASKEARKIVNTNPFKQNITSPRMSEMKTLPPLPPRPNQIANKHMPPKTNSNVEDSAAAPPVLYDIPEKTADESVEPTGAGIKNTEPVSVSNHSVPVYNNILINPVGINKQRNENYDEDSWDANNSYSGCDPIDATSAESIEKDSSNSCNDQKSTSSGKSNNSIEDNRINCSSSTTNKKSFNSVPFVSVKVLKGNVNIYKFENSGWILMDQYRSAFTAFDDNVFIFTTIDSHSYNIPMKKITVEEYPEIFEHYNQSLLDENLRENVNDLNVLDLIPVTHVLKLSRILSVVNREEIDRIKNRNYESVLSFNMIDLLKLLSSNERIINEETNN